MTPTQCAEAIRAALDAGPTPGPWTIEGRIHPSGEALRIRGFNSDGLHGYNVADVIEANGYPENEANARLIAAASPATLTSLLEEREALRAALERIKLYRAVNGDDWPARVAAEALGDPQ